MLSKRLWLTTRSTFWNVNDKDVFNLIMSVEEPVLTFRVYLDCCCFQRPLDDQTQPRIRVETEAVLATLTAVQSGELTLLTSEALEYELNRNPDENRRNEGLSLLTLASERLLITDETEQLATALVADGIKPMDALHLASASLARADFFATCDDRFLRRAKTILGLNCSPVSILELLQVATK